MLQIFIGLSLLTAGKLLCLPHIQTYLPLHPPLLTDSVPVSSFNVSTTKLHKFDGVVWKCPCLPFIGR